MIRWLRRLFCRHKFTLYVRDDDTQRLWLRCDCGHTVPALKGDADYGEHA